jgi:hypothetical protein
LRASAVAGLGGERSERSRPRPVCGRRSTRRGGGGCTSRPIRRGDLEVVEPAPGPLGLDQLGLVPADHRLRERVVERGATAPTEGLNPALSSRCCGPATRTGCRGRGEPPGLPVATTDSGPVLAARGEQPGTRGGASPAGLRRRRRWHARRPEMLRRRDRRRPSR